MISAFKRLVNSNDAKTDTKTENSADSQLPTQQTGPSFFNNGMHMISQSLQKKFSKGVNYNSKFFSYLKLRIFWKLLI